MSTRINKVIGYGTDKLVMKDGELADPRFEADGFYGKREWTLMTEHAITSRNRQIQQAFVEEFLEERRAEDIMDFAIKEALEMNTKRMRGLVSGVVKAHFDFEYSDIPAMVLVPPNMDGWHRHDDTIDYHEHGSVPGGHFKYLEGACWIFPLTGEMRRFQGQQRFEWEPKNLEAGHYNHLTGSWDNDVKPILGGDDLDDFRANWRPTLPWLILIWIQLQDWITDKKGFADMLRPCIYVYWS